MSVIQQAVEQYNHDPKFSMQAQRLYRENLLISDYANTEFQSQLSTGSQINIDTEIHPRSQSPDPAGDHTVSYEDVRGFQEGFEINDYEEVAVRVLRTDRNRSVHNIQSQILSNGDFAMKQEIERKGFEHLVTKSTNVNSIDLTTASNDEEAGNALLSAIEDLCVPLQALGNDKGDKVGMNAWLMKLLKKAKYLRQATTLGDELIRKGSIYTVDGLRMDNIVNFHADATNFDVSANGAIAVATDNDKKGVRKIAIDNGGTGTINAPYIGDTLQNGGQTFRIRAVETVTAGESYVITVDRPLISDIADDATITITGNHTMHCPMVQGSPLHLQIQADPQYESFPDPDKQADLIRTNGGLMWGAFLTLNAAERVNVLKAKYRNIV